MADRDRDARYKRRIQQLNRKINQLTEALSESLDTLESVGDVEAIAKENEQLKAAMTEGAYRVAWEAAAEKAGVDPEYFDDLWRLAPPEMTDADPDPKKIAAHVKESIAGRKVLLAARDEDDDDEEGDQGDDEEEKGDGDPFGYFSDDDDEEGGAKAKPTGKPKAKTVPVAKPAAKPTEKPEKPATKPKLTDGEGARRGGRDASVNRDPFAVIERDFAATGRSDPFKL